MRLIGDVHGKFKQYKRILNDSPPSVQVGDMGVGFFNVPLIGDEMRAHANPPFDKMVQGNHRFIRGNHDNPQACKTQAQWIPDGLIENGIMFIGGADSIDKALRTEGFDWWKDEELSINELNALVDAYITAKPRVMITHDCPEEIAEVMQAHSGRAKLDSKSRTRQAFQAMWSAHSPELWVYGHWHYSFDGKANGTRFVCLAELEYRDDLI